MNHTALKRDTLQGYNTLYNNSVLTHVLMPECFAVSLGFKFYNTGKVLRESLIGRFGAKYGELVPGLAQDVEQLHPGPRSYDGSYTELKLSCSGHELVIQSAAVEGSLYLLVTPVTLVKRPPSLLISASVLWNRPGYVEHGGENLKASLPGRVITVHTDGEHERQLNTGLTNPYLSVKLDRPIAISTDCKITAGELKQLMERQKQQVLDECAKYGGLSEAYTAMRTCLAWDTIYEPENDQICSPVSRLWNISWGGYVLFDWDTYFSAMIAMVDDKNLAYTNLIAITKEKTEAGFIPNFGAADDDKSRDRSQPPVGALALKEIYRIYREKWIVEYLFDDLLAWNRWFAGNRRLANGQLCWGSDPYEGHNGKWTETVGVDCTHGGALESGLDNSPMYDDIPFDKENHIMHLADVGLTGMYIMDCEALAELAALLGRPEESELRERAELSKQGLEEMWDEDFGMYLNKRTDTGELSRRISPTNFYALFSDKVSPARARRMIDEHYYNDEEFYGEFVIPTIARNDPAYPDQEYWRGRIWAPTNYLAYLAMRRHDLPDACKDLAEKSKNLILQEWSLHGHVHENYNGDTGMGCDIGSSDKFYHWGGLLTMVALTEAGYITGPEKPL